VQVLGQIRLVGSPAFVYAPGPRRHRNHGARKRLTSSGPLGRSRRR
jgi:hypothetical protein